MRLQILHIDILPQLIKGAFGCYKVLMKAGRRCSEPGHNDDFCLTAGHLD